MVGTGAAAGPAAAAGLTIVGGGKMGAALADGLVAAGRDPASVAVVEANADRRAELAGRSYRVEADLGSVDAALRGEVVLAVKPPEVAAAAGAAGAGGAGRVLSIAAGVTLARLESWLAPSAGPGGGPARPPAVVRAMPNTPVLVGAGASALALGSSCDEDDRAWAVGILGSVGTVVVVDEPLLDAVTGLSGSGPAYAFLLVEAMVDAGVLAGLPRPVALELAAATLHGAGRLLVDSGDEPAVLRAAVTSPGGTTAAGLHALEAGGLRAIVADAVLAAADRSRQLGA